LFDILEKVEGKYDILDEKREEKGPIVVLYLTEQFSEIMIQSVCMSRFGPM
jgi:hypothetical protein